VGCNTHDPLRQETTSRPRRFSRESGFVQSPHDSIRGENALAHQPSPPWPGARLEQRGLDRGEGEIEIVATMRARGLIVAYSRLEPMAPFEFQVRAMSREVSECIAALANVKANTAYLDDELCGVDDAGLPSFARTQAATDVERGVGLVYYAFDLLRVRLPAGSPSHSKHKRRSSEARHPKRRIGPRPVSRDSLQRQTWLANPILFAFSSPQADQNRIKREKIRFARPVVPTRTQNPELGLCSPASFAMTSARPPRPRR
jgi:hypothetical protein